jgi:hypothetical protein
MAYITTEQVKEIREALKKKFPSNKGWKFSVTREHRSGVKITVISGPANFDNRPGTTITPNRETHPYLQQIYNIANSGNHDNSDAMTDYFDVGFYVWLSVGTYDKPYQFIKA